MRPLFITWLLGGTVLGACTSTPTAAPPSSPPTGFLAQIGSSSSPRDLEPCEQAHLPHSSRGSRFAKVVLADLDEAPGRERVVVDVAAITVLTADCTRALADFRPPQPKRDGAGVTSLESSPWTRVSPEKMSELGSTDRLPSGRTNFVAVLSTSTGRQVFVQYAVGAIRSLQVGYEALFISCRSGGCRADLLAHAEYVPAPTDECHLTRRSVDVDFKGPLLWVEPVPRTDELELTQLFQERQSCRLDEVRVDRWRAFRLTPGGLREAPLERARSGPRLRQRRRA